MIKEACVETFEAALLAERRGADRIEICADLANGGVTPAPDLMQKTCSKVKIPVMVMIRPRAGNFVYTKKEIMQMKKDIDLAKKTGAAGVVFGLLTTENTIDQKHTRVLTEYARPLPVTFHKAIDVLENPVEGVRVLNKIEGIRRVLTSGGKATASEGVETIRKMREAAGENLIILVAGKVTDKNVEEVRRLTWAEEFHGRRIVGEIG
jgi:copper homeostasis protein